jgi:hypothetical protein
MKSVQSNIGLPQSNVPNKKSRPIFRTAFFSSIVRLFYSPVPLAKGL